jgi:hypothetical protein
MTFSISTLVSVRDSHIKSDTEVGVLIWVEDWYGKVHDLIILYRSHILHWIFRSIDFYIAEKIFELTSCENKLPLFNLQRQVSKRYQIMSICTMTLECVCKIYPRRWHLSGNSYSTQRMHLSQLFHFKLFKLYSKILKCVNLIGIRFCAFLYTPSSLARWHIMFDTTAQIPEVEFGGKYQYWPWGQKTSTDLRLLLLDIQKRAYCNKMCDNIYTINYKLNKT